VLAAARRKTPDRVPRTIPLERAVSSKLRAYFATEDLRTALNLDIIEVAPQSSRNQTDFSPYFPRPGVTWDEWGRGRIWDSEDHYAEYLYPLQNAESVDEIVSYPWPDLLETYRYAELTNQVSALHAQGYAVKGIMGETVYEVAWQLRSMERLFEDIVHREDQAAALLDAITVRREVSARELAHAGVDILQLGDDVAMQTGLMMSKKMWRAWFRPRLERVIQAARREKPDILIWYHSDGKINDLIPDLIETGVDILNPVQPECVEHQWVKETYGASLSFSGGLGVQSILPFGTPGEVREHVRQTIETLGSGGGLIIGPSHVIERDVPLENILAILEAIDQYGQY
jgi:uroporphyrinogen decarboxylase